MKLLKYKLLQSVLDDGQPVLLTKLMGWSEVNEEIAKKEAYNGEYTIEDLAMGEGIGMDSPQEGRPP